MKLSLIPADPKLHDTLLRNLWQFYLYEFSRFTRDTVTPSGRFAETELDGVFSRYKRHPFLIYADDAVAGFAIVDSGIKSHFTDSVSVIYMYEFFILAGYQKRGLGAQVATRLFDQFPGHWEVFEMADNLAAQHFWRKVIGRYTSGKYREITLVTADGFVQFFDSGVTTRKTD
ncbi:MAG: GNAT family N-acetyltransferase [Anaerolineae bacterium]|nr:GNAT family N-acetyltransferase [Anaerolineae bacterium]